jgi:signal transduction histidine kinase
MPGPVFVSFMFILRLVIYALLLLIAVAPRAEGAEPRRVLLLHSFGRDFAPYDTFAGSFRTELASWSPEPVDVYEASLESARFGGTAEDHPFVDYLEALFRDRQPDLVVSIGGPAARFAQRQRSHLFPGVPMLIAATDERHLEAAALTSSDALVAVRYEPGKILDTMLRLLPKTTHVAVVIGDSPLEQFWLSELQSVMAPFTNRVGVTWLNQLSYPEMLKRCATLPPHSVIFYALLYVDADGVPHREQRALSGLQAVANAPIFGVQDSQLGRGIVGGPLMEIDQLSRNAAAAAVRILGGESPESVRFPVQGPGPPQFDWRELRRWGIDEALLPPGSELLFRHPTLWELHRGRILAIAAVCVAEAVLIILLAANLSRRRRAERSLRESEQRLNLATAAGDLGIWIWDITLDEFWATANWRRMFGFAPDIPIDYQAVVRRIHPEDRVRVDHGVRQARKHGNEYLEEFRLILPDEPQRWIAARGRVEAAGETGGIRMLGVSVDITERKRVEAAARDFSRQLIHAQEEERARLARELHDDVTQRLARLAIDISRTELGTAEASPIQVAREVREGLVRLSEDVHSLSYRLHPAMLEDLGLAAALQVEFERFTEHLPIRGEVALPEMPESLPEGAALCLFRVAQEALRNVERHAQASAVRLTVRVLNGGLQLAVQDNGRGFDPSLYPDRPSLGLVSMRERLQFFGGELDIETGPEQGTTIVAWLPIKTLKTGNDDQNPTTAGVAR